MDKKEFKIGQSFFTTTGKWLCTDIGQRIITAIKLDREDESWFNGPPYAIEEVVFDENDMPACTYIPQQIRHFG